MNRVVTALSDRAKPPSRFSRFAASSPHRLIAECSHGHSPNQPFALIQSFQAAPSIVWCGVNDDLGLDQIAADVCVLDGLHVGGTDGTRAMFTKQGLAEFDT